jgi:hypothetical protein
MHAVAIQLAPIIGAEKSKVPFYIAGGALVAWALVLSVGLGMRKPEFPGNATGERVVIAITTVLVLAAGRAASEAVRLLGHVRDSPPWRSSMPQRLSGAETGRV